MRLNLIFIVCGLASLAACGKEEKRELTAAQQRQVDGRSYCIDTLVRADTGIMKTADTCYAQYPDLPVDQWYVEKEKKN